MAVTGLFKLHGVSLGSTHVGAIESQTITPGITVTTDAASGLPRAEFQALTAMKPTVDFTGYNIASILDVTTTVGKNLANLSGGLILYGQAMAEGGTRASGSSHYSFTMNDGVVFPTTLTAAHQQYATLACRALITYDGTNAPIIPAASASLQTITDTARFGIGTVTIGGTAFTQVTNLSIDFGVNAKAVGSDSEVYDTYAYVETLTPKITIRGTLPSWFGSSGVALTGKAATQANTTIYLRKYSDGGMFVANGTAEHIKINAAGLATVNSVNASNDGEGEIELVLNVVYDGTNESLLIDTTSTIA